MLRRSSSASSVFVPRGDCARAERQRVWSETCPRCQEIAGAGVCPAPGTLADFALLFNKTFVLCYGKATCPRHRKGYWPQQLHERMSVYDGRDLDRILGHRVGLRVAALLGIAGGAPRTREAKALRESLKIVRHRVLALLASLKMVEMAHDEGLSNVLVLEGDVRPVPWHALSAVDVDGMRTFLGTNPWQIGGLPQSFPTLLLIQHSDHAPTPRVSLISRSTTFRLLLDLLTE